MLIYGFGYGGAAGAVIGTSVALLGRVMPYRVSVPVVAALPCAGALVCAYENKGAFCDTPMNAACLGAGAGYAVTCLAALSVPLMWRRVGRVPVTRPLVAIKHTHTGALKTNKPSPDGGARTSRCFTGK